MAVSKTLEVSTAVLVLESTTSTSDLSTLHSDSPNVSADKCVNPFQYGRYFLNSAHCEVEIHVYVHVSP